jgi:hypothetical protein
MKVIDLLNKIVDGELQPKTKIKYYGETYIYDYPNLCGIYKQNMPTSKENDLFFNFGVCNLNHEVELIEEENKEIDTLGDGMINMETQEEVYSFKTNNEKALKNKINELVRAVNKISTLNK